jgi:hypothetical protein
MKLLPNIKSKNIKIAQRSFNVGTISRNQLNMEMWCMKFYLCENKEDVTLALKSYRKWIDQLWARIGASNDLRYCESYQN